MSGYRFTPQAFDDLFDILDFIAQPNPEASKAVEQAIFRACDLLVSSPLAGSVRSDLTPLPLRFWVVHPYSNYLIVYDPAKKPLEVIRILHAARDIPALLT